ncbi:DUF1329 domain-containing protein [Noviherbaspirillum sp.]|uniref:DUF1329 domain-containing protein n=1 Tax=Noviherbaspirillum sp. TaxID=1926288 RepID=UPI002FE23FF4
MKFKQSIVTIVMLSLAAATQAAGAAVTAEEAARLMSELTPFGAERAGNRSGTIPAWEGGYTKVPPGYQSGQPRPDPFAEEKPRLTITAQNMNQYADQLSDGVKALLQRFPTYRLDVYPTHRSAAAPQWVYDNTFKNATRAKLGPGGLSIEGAQGGIAFPIPKNGEEAMWNHLFSWKGEAYTGDISTYVVTAGRKPVLAAAATLVAQMPYYYRDSTPKQLGTTYGFSKFSLTAPPFLAGETSLTVNQLKQGRQGSQSWQYLVGQRRVRRAPNFEYDSPNLSASGISFFDEIFLFDGSLDRYDWKLLGKKEMFVPYNINTEKLRVKNVDDVLQPYHLNPANVRWELHRVWVVEATLSPGKRHVMPKRRLYLDEDTWQALLYDGWDANGQLWHTGQALPLLAPEVPALLALPNVMYDFLKGAYVILAAFHEHQRDYQVAIRRPEEYFSPAALMADGIR